MHEKISHLSEDELQELKRLYYDSAQETSVSEIIARFNIDVRPSDLSSLLPETIHEEVCCYCENRHLVSKAPSRSSQQKIIPICPGCGHQNISNCSCQNCRTRALEEQKSRDDSLRAKIHECYGTHALKAELPAQELSLREAIYLKAAVSHSASENLDYIYPYFFGQAALAPSESMIFAMLKHLYHETRTIAPCPDSDLNAFVANEDKDCPSFYLGRVDWLLLPTLSDSERSLYLKEVDDELRMMSELDEMEGVEHELWHEIVKCEALEYFEHKLSEVRIDLGNIAKRTNAIFDDLVNRFSLAEIYHIIFVTIRNTHHYIGTKGIGRSQARNLYVSGVERNANKYEAEGWLKKYRRDFNCPQSTISAAFFDFYLGIGSSYFDTRIPRLPEGS